VCLFVLFAAMPAGAEAPKLATGHAWLTGNPGGCVSQGTNALRSAGFSNIQSGSGRTAGTNPFLSAAVECVASGNRTLATVAVTGPASTGPAADAMKTQLLGLLGGNRPPAAATAAAAPAVAGQRTSTMHFATNFPGSDIKSVVTDASPHSCKQLCIDEPRCAAWTWVKPGRQGNQARCWLKSGVLKRVKAEYCVSGVIQ
jgi:hypothetical protein